MERLTHIRESTCLLLSQTWNRAACSTLTRDRCFAIIKVNNSHSTQLLMHVHLFYSYCIALRSYIRLILWQWFKASLRISKMHVLLPTAVNFQYLITHINHRVKNSQDIEGLRSGPLNVKKRKHWFDSCYGIYIFSNDFSVAQLTHNSNAKHDL